MLNHHLLSLHRSISILSCGTRSFELSRSVSILKNQYNSKPIVDCAHYIVRYGIYNMKFNHMGQMYSTDSNFVVPIVTYEDVKNLPNHPEKTLIDVREPNELRETGTIPTSINIPLGEVNTALSLNERQFKTKYSQNKPGLADEIIFHCGIGFRSQNAAIFALKLGFTNAKNYKGSWQEWAEREGLTK